MASTTTTPPVVGPHTHPTHPTATTTTTATARAPVHPYKEVLAGSVAAVASTLVCHPIDVLRTELQTQAHATSARACLRRIGACLFVLFEGGGGTVPCPFALWCSVLRFALCWFGFDSNRSFC